MIDLYKINIIFGYTAFCLVNFHSHLSEGFYKINVIFGYTAFCLVNFHSYLSEGLIVCVKEALL